MKINYKKGFTLVEIMIVVAIIGIVIAIAVPAFLRAREQSRGTACSENLAKIDGAVEQYALEKKLGQGAAVTMNDIVMTDGALQPGSGYLKSVPECPAGGDYGAAFTVGTAPVCTYESGGTTFAWMHDITPVNPNP